MQAYSILANIAVAASWIVLGTGLLQALVSTAQLALAAHAMAVSKAVSDPSELWRRYSPSTPKISLLVPAFNEAKVIVSCVRSLQAANYPDLEIIVINDGSTDETLQVLIKTFDLTKSSRLFPAALRHKSIRNIYTSSDIPGLVVADKLNGGKADALNAGINLARSDLFCSIDADSMLEPNALMQIVRPFIDRPDRVIAVGGAVRVGNGNLATAGQITGVRLSTNLLALFQTIEYLRAFMLARIAWSHIGSLTIVSGAFGLFRRDRVLDVGGYTVGTVGEDLELVLKLHRNNRDVGRPYDIVFLPEPICWTEAPEDLATLSRQRARWQRGSLESFFRHRGLLMNPRYGRIGMIAFVQMLLVDIIGPPIEVLGYLLIPTMFALGLIDQDFMWAFLALTFAFGVFVSVSSLILEESAFRRLPRARDLVVLAGVAVIENFGYRQLANVWRVIGLWQYLRRQTQWGKMVRRGVPAA